MLLNPLSLHLSLGANGEVDLCGVCISLRQEPYIDYCISFLVCIQP